VNLISCAIAAALAMVCGCLPPLPVNAGDWPNVDGAAPAYLEAAPPDAAEVADAAWLAVPRSDEPGTVGGYLSHDAAPDLVLVLTGASTYYWGGPGEKVRDYHEGFSGKLRAEGFRTWTLAPRECGTAYGQGDLADALSVLDWLDGGGREQLGAERVLVVGYSNGGTLAYQLAVRRHVDAIIAVSGVTRADDFERHYGFYGFIATLYPSNIGLCQLGTTLRTYGSPGSPAWSALDAVSHAGDLKSPLFGIHGARDFVFHPDNARAFQQALEQQRGGGAAVPEFEFYYPAHLNHFDVIEDPDVFPRIVAFLRR